MRRSFWLPALLLLAGCYDLFYPPMPEGAVRMAPLPVYAEWWRMTEQCSALGGDFSDVEWFVVPGVARFSAGRLKNVAGMHVDRRIVLAEQSVRHGQLVRHEMLHALLQKGSHPRGDFIGRCGLVVACDERCQSDGRPRAQAADAIVVSDSRLDVSVKVWPENPSESFLGGYIRLTISARNPLDKPVVVQLEPSGDAGPPAAFRWEYRMGRWAYTYDDRAWFPEMTRFAPGETKTMVFDFFITDPERPPMRGVCEFTGAFGQRWASLPDSATIQE
jgi:hypothetical protein